MRILVTGHQGYIGSVLTCVLRHARFEVFGLDSGLFAGAAFGRMKDTVRAFNADIREIQVPDLLSFDAIVHLAAVPDLSASPADARVIDEINHRAAAEFALKAKQAGVDRFVLASTAMVYGRDMGRVFTEADVPAASLPGALAKLRCERAIAQMHDERFEPVFLRIGEVYGVSPMMRMDGVVNDFVCSAVTHGRILMGCGKAGWRSLVHVEDVCRAIAAVLKARSETVSNQIVNIAGPEGPHRVIDIADTLMEMIPLLTRSHAPDQFDPLSVRIDPSKLARMFRELKLRWTLARGIRQLQSAMAMSGVTAGDWRSKRFVRSMPAAREAARYHAKLAS